MRAVSTPPSSSSTSDSRIWKDQPDALSPAGYDRAYKQAVAKFDAVHRLTERIAPDKIGLALTADDVRKISASGRKIALIGVENGWAIGEDLRRVKGSTTAVDATCRSRTTATTSCLLEHRRTRRLHVEGRHLADGRTRHRQR